MAFSILPDDGLRVTMHAPAPALRAHVDGYWSLAVERPPAQVRVVPDGLVDVVFDLVARQVYVTGPRDQPARRAARAPPARRASAGRALPATGARRGSNRCRAAAPASRPMPLFPQLMTIFFFDTAAPMTGGMRALERRFRRQYLS
jgi:hypothetical protein